MKLNRWYLRISLRSLLVLMSILGVGIGLYLNRVQGQARAVAMVERLGGRCWYDFQVDEKRIGYPTPRQSPAPQWLRSVLSDHFFTTVLMVDLDETEFTDKDLQLLSGLPHLKRLDLDGPAVTDATLQVVGRLTSLEELYLFDTLVTDDGLAQVAKLKQLTGLSLSVSRITDRGLAHLRGLKKMKTLYLSNNDISEAGLAHLRDLPALKEVQAYSSNVTAEGGERALPGVTIGTGRSAMASPLRSR